MYFDDRVDAGRQLAAQLDRYRDQDPVVVALPRGGVPVGYEIARALEAPLDVLVARKLGAPGHAEYGIGAVAQGGGFYLNAEAVATLGVTREYLERVARAELAEIDRRLAAYRGDAPPLDVRGRTAIVVDDGLATGATTRAAVRSLRKQQPRAIVLAVPVCAAETAAEVRREVDDVVCALVPEDFQAVGLWYRDFAQTSDDEVVELLERAARERDAAGRARASAPRPTEASVERAEDALVEVPAGGVRLEGNLTVPRGARGVVLFAHGSGSSRHSPRNRFVAAELQRAGLATLLLDLLTADEESIDSVTGELRFDIGLLASRLVATTDWLTRERRTAGLRVGYFGASTGGGAALVAAAERPQLVGAVVSRGGRPDLAGDALARVRAPTLLIVGGADVPVIGMNRAAMAQMRGAPVRLEIVPGATHLFEEQGALERVARLAAGFFTEQLAGASRGAAVATH